MPLARTFNLESDTRHFEIQPSDGGPWTVSSLTCSLLRIDATSAPAMVCTGAQWGPFRVEFESLAGAPANREDWEDVAEISVATQTGLSLVEVPPGRVIEVISEPGTYRLRVSANGRTQAHLRDSAAAESYLIQVWPCPFSSASVLAGCESLEPPIPPYEQVPGYESAIAGADLIGNDVDAMREGAALSGKLGELTVERVMAYRQSRAFQLLQSSVGHGFGTTGTLQSDDVVWQSPRSNSEGAGQSRLVGERGYVRISLIEATPPTQSMTRWEWMVPPEGSATTVYEETVPLLTTPPVRVLNVKRIKPMDGSRHCLASIHHSRLPVEWLDAMTAYWEYHLALTDSLAPLNQ